MKLRLTIDGKAVSATMNDNRTTRDFVSLLPLTLTMEDLFRREKFGHLPKAISEGRRTQTCAAGDVIYWPPGPDVALFYRDQRRPIGSDIIVIGRLDSGVEALEVHGSVRVTFERLDDGPPE